MANYASLKTAIQQVVKTNGNNEITGALLQQSLLAMINSLGANYQFAGVATPTTNPGTPDQNVFYIAGSGTYNNFNGTIVQDGTIAIFKYSGSWTTEIIPLNKIDLGTLVTGQYVYSPTGTMPAASGYVRTGFVDLTGISEILVYIGVKANNVGFAFYSQNNVSSFISGVNSYDYNIGDVIKLTVPANAKYGAFCCRETNVDNFFVGLISVLGTVRELAEEISETQQNVADLSASVDGKFDSLLKYSPNLISNGYVNANNGNVATASSYNYTDYLFIVSKQIKVTAYFGDAAGIAFYDINKSYISGYQRPSTTPSGTLVTVDVPTNAVYLRSSCIANNAANFKLFAVLGENMGEISKKFDSLLGQIIDDSNIVDLGTIYDGIVASGTGAFGPTTASKRTGKIRLNAKQIQVVVTHTEGGRGCAFYDIRGEYISGVNYADYVIGSKITINVPNGTCFFATCATNAYAPLMSVRSLNWGSVINRFMPLTDNPCFYNLTSEARTFKNVLCIGDSLTAGRFDYKEGGTTLEFEDANLSWPAFFAAISGRQTTNVGDAGETTKTWWEIHQNDDLSGHDACVIALGRNDYVTGRETTSAERIQYMTNIVNKVKADNPQIKIFIRTLINYYTGSGADAVNADMRTIAATLPDCYLVDISAYGNLVSGQDNYSHCTAVGYQKWAECYFRYISYIMANNPADFKNVQFVGTNRQY